MFSQLHVEALRAAEKFKTAESELIVLLQKIDACRGYRELGYPSLFLYVNQGLGLSESCTQQLILVSRKSREVPALQLAIAQGELTVSKAKAVVSVLTPENQAEWIALAKGSSTRELERAVAAADPSPPARESVRAKGKELTRVSVDLDVEGMAALRRAQELLAQKTGRAHNLAETIKAIAIQFVNRNDPVAKADRAAARIIHVNDSKPAASAGSSMPASRTHFVHHRDRGACQFRLPSGKLCGSRQWVQIHHKVPRSEGGSDEPSNLITVCSAHHSLIHEKS